VTLTEPAALSPAAVAVIALDGGGRWLIDKDGHVAAEGSAAGGGACDDVEPVALAPEPPLQAADTVAAAVAPVAAAAPGTSWTVARGDTLWGISQDAYGVSDADATVSVINLVFDRNRDQLNDPSALDIGMILSLPPVAL
jgi:nucleoid-associated protein YgaU